LSTAINSVVSSQAYEGSWCSGRVACGGRSLALLLAKPLGNREQTDQRLSPGRSRGAGVWILLSESAHRASARAPVSAFQCQRQLTELQPKNPLAAASAVLAEDNSRYGQGKLAMLLDRELQSERSRSVLGPARLGLLLDRELQPERPTSTLTSSSVTLTSSSVRPRAGQSGGRWSELSCVPPAAWRPSGGG
jgi:hypothetical protein